MNFIFASLKTSKNMILAGWGMAVWVGGCVFTGLSFDFYTILIARSREPFNVAGLFLRRHPRGLRHGECSRCRHSFLWIERVAIHVYRRISCLHTSGFIIILHTRVTKHVKFWKIYIGKLKKPQAEKTSKNMNFIFFFFFFCKLKKPQET